MLLGLTGAVVMTLSMVVVRVSGVSGMNLEMMNGSLLTRSVDPLTWVLGFVIHLLAGVALAVAYASVFERWGRAGWLRGLLLAIPHSLMSGTLLAFMPFIHPAIPEHPVLMPPGFMGAAYGPVTVAGFIGLHLLFGLIVGGGYEVRTPARRAAMSHGPS